MIERCLCRLFHLLGPSSLGLLLAFAAGAFGFQLRLLLCSLSVGLDPKDSFARELLCCTDCLVVALRLMPSKWKQAVCCGTARTSRSPSVWKLKAFQCSSLIQDGRVRC